MSKFIESNKNLTLNTLYEITSFLQDLDLRTGRRLNICLLNLFEIYLFYDRATGNVCY